ncbi:MAG: hypothetical protein AABZ06_10940, partial [Bdellovibrionota bacterium]
TFGVYGTLKKFVSKDEGAALWIRQDLNLSIQKQQVDMLINKADGKVLKLIVNGKEQAVPDDKIEIISQDYAEVTVPAGTFKTVHVIAKTKQIPTLEVWLNPREVVLEGTIKQIATTTFNIDIKMELTSFKRGQ